MTFDVETIFHETVFDPATFERRVEQAWPAVFDDIEREMKPWAEATAAARIRPGSSPDNYANAFRADTEAAGLRAEWVFENARVYAEWVETGRPAGRKPPISNIVAYVADRGLEESAVGRILGSVAARGTEGKWVFRDLRQEFPPARVGDIVMRAFHREVFEYAR
jgi:hypothetical protein